MPVFDGIALINYNFSMVLFKKVESLQKYLQGLQKAGNSVGFVPTMGALHDGHLSLIRQSKEQSDITVCSIFVNPTQFNQKEDLEKYPRTTGPDIELLTSEDSDVLFIPDADEVYPPGLDTSLNLDFGNLANVMEGEFRPGHFDGMAQVVWRLLNIVQPNQLFMGQKDFQQLTIVREMLSQLDSDVELIMCPIVREVDGLAMSSRNVRLDENHRPNAPLIFKTLNAAKTLQEEKTPAEVSAWAMEQFGAPGFKAEYFDIVDGITLQEVKRFEDSDFVVACTAVWLGDVRLIDNLLFKP